MSCAAKFPRDTNFTTFFHEKNYLFKSYVAYLHLGDSPLDGDISAEDPWPSTLIWGQWFLMWHSAAVRVEYDCVIIPQPLLDICN